MIKKRAFIYLFFISLVFFRTGFLRANYFHNYIDKFERLFIADLSDQFKKQQADIWNDYNKCVDIYNSAEYIWSGYLSSSSGGNIVKNRPRIILDSKNGNEFLYKVVVNENRLIGLDHNQKYSFEEKCFQPVDLGLWRVLVGKTYNLDKRIYGMSYLVDLQYVWNDNNKDYLRTYVRTPSTVELQEKVLIRKCSIKVQEKEIYDKDKYGKYTVKKNSNKYENYKDQICINKEKRYDNVKISP